MFSLSIRFALKFHLILTGLQPGEECGRKILNRFNGLLAATANETVKNGS